MTPAARSFSSATYAGAPIRNSAPDSRARVAKAFAAAAGDRPPRLQAPGDEAVGERRLGGAQIGTFEQLRAQLGELRRLRLELVRVVGHEQEADRVRGQLEAAAERGVVLDRLLIERDERRGRAGAGPRPSCAGGACGDRLALVDDDARARLGEERGQRATDDPAADDREVGRALTPVSARECRVARVQPE